MRNSVPIDSCSKTVQLKCELKMKLIFCVTLSLILSCFNVNSAVTVNVVEPGKQGKPGKQIDKSNEGGYKTKPTDLDSDCLFLIFGQLDFDSLLNVAQINQEFSTIAVAVFRREYSHKHFWIYRGFLLSNNSNELINVAGMDYDAAAIEKENRYFTPATAQLSKEYIKLDYGAKILNTFKYFGHLIKNITLKVEGAGQRSKLMARLISKYSSESLVDVTVDFYMTNVLSYITEPLINVENLTLRFDDTNENRRPIGLNERFPALRRLYLRSFVAIRSVAYFSYLIPNLEHVEIGGADDEFKTFEGLIFNNPQIRSLTLANIDSRYIQDLNELLPQLETLVLMNLKLNSERIRFENVTTLTIGYSFFGEMSSDVNLEFPHLQTLYIESYGSVHFAKHRAFLKELNHLTHLQLRFSKMPDSEFKQLTQNLTNLVELTLKFDGYLYERLLTIDAIKEFVRSNDKLQRLNIEIKLFEDRGLQQLRNQLEPDWKSKNNGDALSFERKK